MPSNTPVLNPSWEYLLAPVLERNDPRLTNWVRSILFRYIEENIEDLSFRVLVAGTRVDVDREEVEVMGGQKIWYACRAAHMKFEGWVYPVKDRDHQVMSYALQGDPHIISCQAMFDNFFGLNEAPVWLRPNEHKVRFETRVEIEYVLPSGESAAPVVGQDIRVFAHHADLIDLKDWLLNAARVPLTATKLPYKEAVRLSKEWHERENKRRQKQALRKIPTGQRTLIGRLTVRPGFSVPVGTYDVYWLKDKDALDYETVLQHHCVWSYWPSVQSKQTLILHLRNVDRERETDRWTVQLIAFYFKSTKTHVLQVAQMRGVVNVPAHPEFSVGIGNIFSAANGKSALFTEDSHIDYPALIDHLTLLTGVERAIS